jgi:hypothetical protein
LETWNVFIVIHDVNMNIIVDGFLNEHSTQLPTTEYSEAVRITDDTFFHANKDNVNLLYTSDWQKIVNCFMEKTYFCPLKIVNL